MDAGRKRAAVTVVLISICAAGSLVRVAFVHQQVISGDEVHQIRVAGSHSLAYILSHFHQADYCILITVWARLLAESVGLEEYGYRLWSYLPGILLLLGAVRLSRAYMEPFERILFALILAGSPLLVYWSRDARPYSAITLLGSLSVVLVLRSVREGISGRLLVWSGLCQLGLLYLNLSTAPSVLGLALAAGIGSLGSQPRGTGAWARLGGVLKAVSPSLLAVCFAAALLSFTLPSLASVLQEKQAPESVTPATFLFSAQLLFGFSNVVPQDLRSLLPLICVPLVVLGWCRIVRIDRRLVGPTLVILLVPALFYSLSSLYRIDRSLVFVRYQAATAPLLLILLALGLGSVRRILGRLHRTAGMIVSTALLSLVVVHIALGPLLTALPPSNPFGPYSSRMFNPELPADGLLLSRVPAFYREEDLRDRVIIEWPSIAANSRLFAAYQTVHQGRVIRCFPVSIPPGGLRFRTMVFQLWSLPTRAPAGAFVVVHQRWTDEMDHVRRVKGTRERWDEDSKVPFGWWNLGAPTLTEQKELFGEPIYKDKWIIVYRI